MQGPEQSYFEDLVVAARRYCRIIDRLRDTEEVSLLPLIPLLPRLHAAVAALQDDGSEVSQLSEWPDFDKRFEMFSRLRDCLGGQDSYWLEYDEVEFTGDNNDRMSGSLADDLTDIYFELKHGLRMLASNSPDQVAHWWHNSFQTHWGQHLVDAERHLYALRACGRLS